MKTHTIFLLDAVGAAFSAALLYALYMFESFFGMPQKVIGIFILVALCCCAYSASIYFIKPKRWKPYLLLIAAVNMGYCLLTIYEVMQHFSSLTLYGSAYFAGEIIIIIVLSAYEMKMTL